MSTALNPGLAAASDTNPFGAEKDSGEMDSPVSANPRGVLGVGPILETRPPLTYPSLTLTNGHPSPALAYLLALSAVLWFMNQARRSMWLVSLMALPGTFCHELCHWVLGKLLNGQPLHFTVLPRREGRGFILGSVGFANLRWYNAFFVGLAPLLMLPLAYGLFLWRLDAMPSLGWPEAAMVFLLANIVFGSLPSGQDLRIAARSPIGWVLLAASLAWGGWRLSVQSRAEVKNTNRR